jgi:hypothetical protein
MLAGSSMTRTRIMGAANLSGAPSRGLAGFMALRVYWFINISAAYAFDCIYDYFALK